MVITYYDFQEDAENEQKRLRALGEIAYIVRDHGMFELRVYTSQVIQEDAIRVFRSI